MMFPDLPFKELSGGLFTTKGNIVGGTYFGGKDDFSLGNKELKKPVRYLRVYEVIDQMQFSG